MINCYTARHGHLHHFATDHSIGRAIAKYGEWAENEIFLLSQCIADGDIVLDVGANIGAHSLAFSRFVGMRGRVFAFEAQHSIYQLLACNMTSNKSLNVDCINCLVGARSDIAYIPRTNVDAETNFGAVSFVGQFGMDGGDDGGNKLPISMICIDDIGLKSCAVIKVDVEGMELDVFIGAKRTIEMLRPVVYFEQTSQRNLAEICQLFSGVGYSLYWHVANPFNANNFLGDKENIFGGTCEVNVVALPKEKDKMAEMLGVSEFKITSPVYCTISLQNSLAGWELPTGAYNYLEEPVMHRTSEQDGGSVQYLRLRSAYDAMMADRHEAQAIMEHQEREIMRLKEIIGKGDWAFDF